MLKKTTNVKIVSILKLCYCRSKKWVINLRWQDLMTYSAEKLYANYVFWANHFEDNQFMNPLIKKRLIRTAVPTLINIPNPPPMLMPTRPLPKQYHEEDKIEVQVPPPLGDSEQLAEEPESTHCK